MKSINAWKVNVTYATVDVDGYEYRVWPNGVVESWEVSDDNVSGYWAGITNSSYDAGLVEKIRAAGLKVLKD